MTKTRKTPSHKRHTTTKSGSSASSKKTDTSPQKENSLRTAPASFEETFGPSRSEEQRKVDSQIHAAVERLVAHEQIPQPTNALMRGKYVQTRSRLRRHIRLLQEYRETLD